MIVSLLRGRPDLCLDLKKFWQVLMDLVADGPRAVLSLVAGLPHGNNIVGINLMEGYAPDLFSHLQSQVSIPAVLVCPCTCAIAS